MTVCHIINPPLTHITNQCFPRHHLLSNTNPNPNLTFSLFRSCHTPQPPHSAAATSDADRHRYSDRRCSVPERGHQKLQQRLRHYPHLLAPTAIRAPLPLLHPKATIVAQSPENTAPVAAPVMRDICVLSAVPQPPPHSDSLRRTTATTSYNSRASIVLRRASLAPPSLPPTRTSLHDS